MMQDQKSLTLHGWSCLGGGSDMAVGIFAHKGGQYCHYGLMLSCSLIIIQYARRQICDDPLTLFSRMGQRTCRLPFLIESPPITRLSIYMTMQPVDCRKDQPKIVDSPLKHR
jgi:hypothetical protein